MSRMNYVLVSPANAKKLNKEFRQQVDGLYILEEKDFDGVPGEFLFQRVRPYEGQIIPHGDAIKLLSGKSKAPVDEILTEDEIKELQEQKDLEQEAESEDIHEETRNEKEVKDE
mgnify:FL=1